MKTCAEDNHGDTERKEDTKSLSENLVSIQASPTQPTVFGQALNCPSPCLCGWIGSAGLLEKRCDTKCL